MNAIVAVDKNWAIGKDNNLLFRIKEDMKFFKSITTDKIVVMGSKTFESIGKALPNRTNMVLTGTPMKYRDIPGIEAYCKGDLDYILRGEQSDDIFIIGGASVYKQYLDKLDNIYVTVLNKEYDADTYFVDLNEDGRFELAEIIASGEHEGSKYTISRWIRK